MGIAALSHKLIDSQPLAIAVVACLAALVLSAVLYFRRVEKDMADLL